MCLSDQHRSLKQRINIASIVNIDIFSNHNLQSGQILPDSI